MKKQARNIILIMFGYYLPAVLILLYLTIFTNTRLLFLTCFVIIIVLSKYILIWKFCRKEKPK